MAKCTLLKLHCYLSDEGDKDEVFLKLEGKKIWPEKAKYLKADKDVVEINVNFEAADGDAVVLELWDYDLLSPNDKLGEFRFQLLSKGGPYRTDLKKEKESSAKYSLEWELH